jgi:hypothetical protein
MQCIACVLHSLCSIRDTKFFFKNITVVRIGPPPLYRLSNKHLSATQREERLREKGRELAIIAVLARRGINLPYERRLPCSLVWSGVVRQLLLPVAVGHPEETGHPFSATSVN